MTCGNQGQPTIAAVRARWLWVKTGEPSLTTENEQNGLLRRSTYQGVRLRVLTHIDPQPAPAHLNVFENAI